MTAPRRVWDRSGCQERVCYCHDDSAITQHEMWCTSCGCRVVDAPLEHSDKCKAAHAPAFPYSALYDCREIWRDGRPFVVLQPATLNFDESAITDVDDFAREVMRLLREDGQA